MLLHWGAGLGTPIKGPVPQRSLLLWLGLGNPSPAAASVMWIYVVLYVCEHICHTYLSFRCGAGDALSQPLTLQHLHLMCLWSTSALLQAGAADQEGCCGPTLHLKCLKVLQPMSIE